MSTTRRIKIKQQLTKPKIQRFLELEKRDPQFIRKFNKGFCHGFLILGLYGAYLESLGMEENVEKDDWPWMQRTLEKMVLWKGKSLKKIEKNERADFDRLISLIEGFQHIYHYLPVGQGHLADYFEDTLGRKMEYEFGFAGLTTCEKLVSVLFEEAFKYDRRLILLSSKKHGLGLFKVGHHIKLFNVNSSYAWESFTLETKEELASHIFKKYKYYHSTPSPLGLHVFSLEGVKNDYLSLHELFKKMDCPLTFSHKETSYSALEIAACTGNKDCVEYYLGQGMPVDAAPKVSHTALSYAASRGHYATAALLLKHGANIDQKQGKLNTPLQMAAKKGRIDIIKLLLEHQRPLQFDHLLTALCYLKPKNNKKNLIQALDPLLWMNVFTNEKINTRLKEYKTSPTYRKAVYQYLLKMKKICTLTPKNNLMFGFFTPPNDYPQLGPTNTQPCPNKRYLL